MTKVSISKLSEEEIRDLGIKAWPIWEKEVSNFDWEYHQEEHCLILEGEFTVETDEGDFHIKAGDYVTFERGLKCKWDITRQVRKHYLFK